MTAGAAAGRGAAFNGRGAALVSSGALRGGFDGREAFAEILAEGAAVKAFELSGTLLERGALVGMGGFLMAATAEGVDPFSLGAAAGAVAGGGRREATKGSSVDLFNLETGRNAAEEAEEVTEDAVVAAFVAALGPAAGAGARSTAAFAAAMTGTTGVSVVENSTTSSNATPG